ncbi:23S rRNA (guanosine(2251)-2'-O)-methyltransferase RlmB [Chloroflexota bacterium]
MHDDNSINNNDLEVIEGKNAVAEALKGGRPINKIMLSRNIQSHSLVAEILHLARSSGIPFEYVDRVALARHTVSNAHQGIIALASAKEYLTLDELLAISKIKAEPPLYLVLDGIEDPQNLGAILRTADAAGIHGVILRARRAAGLTSSVARASAGAIEYVPVARVVNIAQALEELKKNGLWVTGIDMVGEVDYARADYQSPTAIVIGSEGKGLSPLIRKRCDVLAFIPMKGKIASLNASVAAALVMYQAMRQRAT